MSDTTRQDLAQLIDHARQSTENAKSADLPRLRAMDIAEKLWEKLSSMYGYKFLRQFGETPDDVWIRCLLNIEGKKIAHGLQRCLDEYPKWPPGAAQFRALCLDISLDENGREVACRAGIYSTQPTEAMKLRATLALEDPKRKNKRKEIGEKAIGGLLSMFAEDDKQRKTLQDVIKEQDDARFTINAKK